MPIIVGIEHVKNIVPSRIIYPTTAKFENAVKSWNAICAIILAEVMNDYPVSEDVIIA